jgi:hypothetical protein
MSSATSASQSTASSRAFFASPRRRFEKVTWRLTVFSIRRTSTLPRRRPIIFDLYIYLYAGVRLFGRHRHQAQQPAGGDGRPAGAGEEII